MLLYHGSNRIQKRLRRSLNAKLTAGILADAFSTCSNLLDVLLALLNHDRKPIIRFTASQQWTPDW